ncbi:MAG: GTPase HflX [Candidatus Zixiibacteriota bacterium]|nr:MAG: GTPase HflX [candidate division Zixibacteria bacterium]
MIEYANTDTEKALLVGLARDARQRNDVEASLDELAQLTYSANARVVGRRVQTKERPNPAFYIGSGLVGELKEQLPLLGGNCVIFDDALTPAQQRNLESELGVKVIDRPVLILDIFATRARTAAARLQVELAQLEYTLPRLTGAWVHFSRQYGGIGAKGPGETQLEIDRRQVRTKIAHLKQRLEKLGRQRTTQRKRRQNLYKVALVGYTNAGKSTLFNQLTKAKVRTEDMLFTTLDSTTRVMSAGYPCHVVFSDTVGFIKKLPHELVESFKSTLEEVSTADLLLQIVDSSDPNYRERMEHTRQVLSEIGADDIPYLLVFNKIDVVADFHPPESNSNGAFLVSALHARGISAVQAEILAGSQRFLSRFHKHF